MWHWIDRLLKQFSMILFNLIHSAWTGRNARMDMQCLIEINSIQFKYINSIQFNSIQFNSIQLHLFNSSTSIQFNYINSIQLHLLNWIELDSIQLHQFNLNTSIQFNYICSIQIHRFNSTTAYCICSVILSQSPISITLVSFQRNVVKET